MKTNEGRIFETSAPAAQSAPPPSQGYMRRIFFGRFGMRAGWGIAIFIAIIVLVTIGATIVRTTITDRSREVVEARAYAKAHALPEPALHLPFVPEMLTGYAGVTFFGLMLACWIFSRAERRSLHAYGLGSYRWKNIFPGAFWGLLAMSCLVAVLDAMHLLVFEGRALYGIAILWWGLRWLLAFSLVAFSEEYCYRGYLQYTLTRGLWGLAEKLSPTNVRATAFWLAAAMLSGLFTLAHLGNQNETFLGLTQVFLAGMTLAYGLWRTGSLWWSIGMHMTWDWTQSFLFGVADSGNVSVGRLFVTHPVGNPVLSGGSDGPEGSLLGMFTLLALCLVVRFTTRAGVQPALESTACDNAVQNPILSV
jgi:hypothetical protein